MLSTCGFLVLGLLLLSGYRLSRAQEASLNFCDLPCVNNIYKFYCGEAKCTTGASDYAQIFQLCTDRCVAAVAGEVMRKCLTVTVPDRADWAAVQLSVVQEIVEFCSGYDIAVDKEVPPLTLKETDEKLLDTLYDDPEGEKEKKGTSKKPGKGTTKGKKGPKSKNAKASEKEEDKKDKKKSEPTEKRPKKSTEKRPKKPTKKPSKKTTSTPSVKKASTESKNNGTTSTDLSSPSDVVPEEEVMEEKESNTTSSDLDDEAMGSVIAEETGSEIEETLDAFESPK